MPQDHSVHFATLLVLKGLAWQTIKSYLAGSRHYVPTVTLQDSTLETTNYLDRNCFCEEYSPLAPSRPQLIVIIN